MPHETIETGLRDNILTITLHRPERLNAFNPKMLEELLEASSAGRTTKTRCAP